MDEFVKLADEVVLTVKTVDKIRKPHIAQWVNTDSFETISEYEIQIKTKKTEFRSTVKSIFDNLDVLDLKISEEGVESILFDLFKKDISTER
jgi:ABC-type uncharacterized transport system ATPase subunit